MSVLNPRLELALVPLALVAALALLTTADVSGGAVRAQQPETSLGIDADTEGNTATTLGTIDECVEISEGESHAVDIFVLNVTDLLAWEAVLTFEPEVIEIVDEDARLLLAAAEGSQVQDLPGELPDSDGHFQMAAADFADPAAPESGSGLLARVTVKGVGPGVSELRLPLSDRDGDGNPDEGPLLRDVDINSIGDENGDTLFDGPIGSARIAVDASCTDEPGPAPQPDGEGQGDGDGIDALTVVVVVVGLVAVAGLVAAWVIRRQRRT